MDNQLYAYSPIIERPPLTLPNGARVMCLALHPFIVGQPFRHKYLDRALEYIASHDGVWLTTSDEIAEWYFANAYDAAVKQLSTRSAAAVAV